MPTKAEIRKQEHAEEVRVVLGECALTPREAESFLASAHVIGRQLHAIYERQCNGHQKPNGDWDEEAAARDDGREEKLEACLRKLFKDAGLGLYLNTDPRGNPVGILTHKTGRYNTMGGRECGWRL